MKSILGIDVGGSTTKVVSYTNSKLNKPMLIKADDPMTSFYGGLGKYLNENSLSLNDIDKIVVTGVGSSHINNQVYGLNCVKVSEFECIGLGGIYLAGNVNECVVVSMGTGTANVYCNNQDPNNVKIEYLGGTGVGGGTVIGLSSKFLGVNTFEHIVQLAENGNLNNVDLIIKDMYKSNTTEQRLSDDLTAANFGKLSDLATNSDIALGILNMVYETIGMTSLFAARTKGTNNLVLTGNLSNTKLAKSTFEKFNKIFKTNFIIPNDSQFATSIGAALYGSKLR